MIEVSHLVKKYGSHYAVNDLSFRVEKGQIYGFLGPNGAGKSTTMNIITGYLAPTAGEVRINGHDMMKEPEEAKRCIGYLPEMPPVYPDMTVGEYLRFAAQLKRIPSAKREDSIEEVMKMTRILDMKDRLIRNLSKGYKQRVGLSQALLGSPEIIILDEPTVGLDPKQIIEIRDLIKSLKDKHTVILSSHILSEVSAICDQILIISKGRLAACDTPEGLTRLMTGEEELEITVKGAPEELQSVLGGLEEIENSSLEKISEAQTKAVIKTGEDCDIRERLFYLLADARLPLMDMHVTAKSLEDIFLELTDSEKNTVEKAGEEVGRKKLRLGRKKEGAEVLGETEVSRGADGSEEVVVSRETDVSEEAEKMQEGMDNDSDL